MVTRLIIESSKRQQLRIRLWTRRLLTILLRPDRQRETSIGTFFSKSDLRQKSSESAFRLLLKQAGHSLTHSLALRRLYRWLLAPSYHWMLGGLLDPLSLSFVHPSVRSVRQPDGRTLARSLSSNRREKYVHRNGSPTQKLATHWHTNHIACLGR